MSSTEHPISFKHLQREESAGFDRSVQDYIQRASATGLYEIRGLGAKRKLPHFDDLVFLAASLSRYPLEGYRERCVTKTVLGTRFARKPIELDIPITIAGMSFGSLSANVKEALGRAATAMGTSTTTGDGGMTSEERDSSKTLIYQCLPSRYGFDPDDVRRADAIEVVIGQGAKPGGGGMLLGQKVGPRVAKMRTLPEGVDQRSACRHPDWTGPDDLAIKIQELREITDWEKPIYVKVGATRVFNDVKLAVHSGADVVVVDGMQGGTAATQTCFITRGYSDVGGRAPGSRRAGRSEHEGQGTTDCVGRYPHRCRRGQGDCDGGGRGVTWPRYFDEHGLQPRDVFPERPTHQRRGGLCRVGYRPWILSPLPHRQVPGGRDHTRRDSGAAPATRMGRQTRTQLFENFDHGTHNPGPRLRQTGCAPPGTRRSGGPHRRSRCDGPPAAGRNELDTRVGGTLNWFDRSFVASAKIPAGPDACAMAAYHLW